MALADIITKLEADALEEAARIIEAAEQRAAVIQADAERAVEEHRAATLGAADADARREAARIVVSARIEARDGVLVQRRQLIDEVLEAAADRLASAPDRDYATFLARRISHAARGGETLLLGSADSRRSEAVAEALRMIAPGLQLIVATDPAPFERGALIEGDRVRADLSLEAIVEESREELELVVASVLFAEEA